MRDNQRRPGTIQTLAAAALIHLMLAASSALAQEVGPDAPAVPDASAPPAAAAPGPAADDPAAAGNEESASAADAAVEPWTVACSEPEAEKPATCQVAQTIVNSETRQRLVTVSIRKQPQGLSMVVALPHGLLLPGGVTYQIDSGKPQHLPIELSDGNGVYAITPVDDALINSMKRGAIFKVGLIAVNRRQISIPMTLTGFTAASEEAALSE